MRTTTMPREQQLPRGRLSLSAVPDRLIGVYFAVFALSVTAFLATQALRAHTVERMHAGISQPSNASTR